jgi:hypothetical protein
LKEVNIKRHIKGELPQAILEGKTKRLTTEIRYSRALVEVVKPK